MSSFDASADVIYQYLLMKFEDQELARKTYMRFYRYLTEAFDFKQSEIDNAFKAVEPVNKDQSFVYDQLITVMNMRCATVCPHHLLPVELNVHVGYVPNEKILGLSKFARVAEEY